MSQQQQRTGDEDDITPCCRQIIQDWLLTGASSRWVSVATRHVRRHLVVSVCRLRRRRRFTDDGELQTAGNCQRKNQHRHPHFLSHLCTHTHTHMQTSVNATRAVPCCEPWAHPRSSLDLHCCASCQAKSVNGKANYYYEATTTTTTFQLPNQECQGTEVMKWEDKRSVRSL